MAESIEITWACLQVQLLLFVCCVGTLVLKKALVCAGDGDNRDGMWWVLVTNGRDQLEGLLHRGAIFSFDVADVYHRPRSCLITCCPIIRGCHIPRQRISQALDDHSCDVSSKTLRSTRCWKGVNEHGFSSPWTPPSSSLVQAPGIGIGVCVDIWFPRVHWWFLVCSIKGFALHVKVLNIWSFEALRPCILFRGLKVEKLHSARFTLHGRFAAQLQMLLSSNWLQLVTCIVKLNLSCVEIAVVESPHANATWNMLPIPHQLS